MCISDHYDGAVLEDIRQQMQRMADVPGTVRRIDERLTRVEEDIKIIKAVVTDQGKQLKVHESLLAS